MRRDKGKRWIVETETLRLSLLPGELRPADRGRLPPAPSSRELSPRPRPWTRPVLELHLSGMRLEEAMRLVEKQIDSALVHGLREFSIVHGKGEGILRTADPRVPSRPPRRGGASAFPRPRRAGSARPSSR